jgi:protein tyrosine phosphatase (PTP) superfamily phosphohydrolase (DUF442 family)
MPAIRNFYKVSDGLACAGQPSEEQLKQLAAEGYQVIINLGLLNTIYALPDEAATVAVLGMNYYHIPVQFDSPQISELANFIGCMNQHTGKKMLVHCAANYRASVFTGLYLLVIGEIAVDEVQDFVEDAWQPNGVWQLFLEEGSAWVGGLNKK